MYEITLINPVLPVVIVIAMAALVLALILRFWWFKEKTLEMEREERQYAHKKDWEQFTKPLLTNQKQEVEDI